MFVGVVSIWNIKASLAARPDHVVTVLLVPLWAAVIVGLSAVTIDAVDVTPVVPIQLV